MELDDEYSIVEVPILKSWAGKSIREIGVQAQYGINIIGVVRNGVTNIMPTADYEFIPGDHMQIISNREAVERLLKAIDKGL